MISDNKQKDQKQNLSFIRKTLRYFPTRWIIGFLLGLIVYAAYVNFYEYSCRVNHPFINSSFACNEEITIRKGLYTNLQNKISLYLVEQQTQGHIKSAGVYFRDLKNGPFFGINEDKSFTPASLLKLPLSFVVFDLLDKKPELLNIKILFDGSTSIFNQIFQSSNKLDLNKAYSITELMEYMLKYSDNDAYVLLRMFLDENGLTEKIKQTYLELGFVEPQDVYTQSMNVREYSSFFRLLYNASYLSMENSETILKWLSESDFDYGIRANLPKSVKIAHKFGQRDLSDGLKYLHDCGIIYYPHNPYLLCVMTEGEQTDELINFINYVSNEVYKEVDSRKI